jgi:hypothetical protein
MRSGYYLLLEKIFRLSSLSVGLLFIREVGIGKIGAFDTSTSSLAFFLTGEHAIRWKSDR